jgi:hypothetical protein
MVVTDASASSIAVADVWVTAQHAGNSGARNRLSMFSPNS